MVSLNDVKYILFGVQFNHSFKLLDEWGYIADGILYKNKYFDEVFFSQISTQYTTERSLSNPSTGNVLTLSANNLVFKYYLTGKSNFQKEFDYFCERINKYLIPEILSKHNLITRRTGMVFACEMKVPDLQKFSKKYFKDEVQGVTDFRFAQKETTLEGRMWKGNNNYINKIYTSGQINEDFKGVTYDFQVYYNPLLSDIREECPEFLKQSLIHFKKDILKMED